MSDPSREIIGWDDDKDEAQEFEDALELMQSARDREYEELMRRRP